MSNKRLYERYGIVSEVRMVRALLDGAREAGAIVCVDADGTRWGHYQLTPNNDGLIADWRARDGGRADVLADRICGME